MKEYHRSCTDNLHEALKELGLTAPQVPSPFNLWMNIPWTEAPQPCGSLEFVAPVSKPGDYIVMKAEMDCIVAFSACPQVTLAAPLPRAALRTLPMHGSTLSCSTACTLAGSCSIKEDGQRCYIVLCNAEVWWEIEPPSCQCLHHFFECCNRMRR